MPFNLPFSHHAITRARQLSEMLKDGHGLGAGIVESGRSYTFTKTDRRNLTLLNGLIEPITAIREYIFRTKRPGRKKQS